MTKRDYGQREEYRQQQSGPTAVHVSNLHYSIMANELKVGPLQQTLFEEIGPVSSCRLQFDRIGRSEVGSG